MEECMCNSSVAATYPARNLDKSSKVFDDLCKIEVYHF